MTASSSTPSKPTLISFKICPFVQRAAIVLAEKGIEFNLEYVDLQNLPESFKSISPFGKVPVLRVDGHSIFESAVINEYLDEVYGPSLHPIAPLEKARHRAWIEFASELTFSNYRLMIAKTKDEYEAEHGKLKTLFERLEDELDGSGPYFSGSKFALIDAAFAPVFMRLDILNDYHQQNIYISDSKVGHWHDALLGRDSVQTSVAADFRDAFLTHFSNESYYLSRYLTQSAAA